MNNEQTVPPLPNKSSNKLNSMQFLYFGKDLLLQATPKETIMSSLDKSDLTGAIKFMACTVLPGFDEITNHCNKKIKDLKRIQIEPRGFHVPSSANVSKDSLKQIVEGNVDLKDMNNFCERIAVKSLNEDDYTKPVKGGTVSWLSFMIPDGKVFPYTILQDSALSKYGFPIGLYTEGNEDIDPSSIKHVYYVDPRTQKLMKGVYFEVLEGPGPKGSGGVNGIIVEEGKPLVIINNTRKEAYFVNVNESAKGPRIDLLSSQLTVVG